MKLNNYREPAGDGQPSDTHRSNVDNKGSARGEPPKVEESPDVNSLENFQLEDIPSKMILVEQKTSEETHMIVYHSGNLLYIITLITYYRGPVQPPQTHYRSGQETFQGAR